MASARPPPPRTKAYSPQSPSTERALVGGRMTGLSSFLRKTEDYTDVTSDNLDPSLVHPCKVESNLVLSRKNVVRASRARASEGVEINIPLGQVKAGRRPTRDGDVTTREGWQGARPKGGKTCDKYWRRRHIGWAGTAIGNKRSGKL